MPTGQIIEGAAPRVREVGVRRRLEYGLRVSLFVALCAILIFGPLAFGIVQDWSVAVFEIAAAFILLLWMAWQLAAREIRVEWSPLFAPMLVFFGIVLAQIAFHRTAYLYDSLCAVWTYVAYGILLFVAVQLLQPGNGFGFTLPFGKTMALFGSVYAVFAVLQGFTSGNDIYWLITPRVGSVYGSYVNHNHYAGLMELLLPFPLVLAFGGSIHTAKRFLFGCAATLMAASVFLCQSRGGMFAVVVETAFLAIFWMRQFSPKKSAAVFVAFCLITALFLAWIAPQQVGSRMTNIHDPARWLIHRDSRSMFVAHPLLGSGFGTFPTAFPHYRTSYDGFFVNHAHDDYLELLLEMGLAGFGVAIWFLVVLYREERGKIHAAKSSPVALTSKAALAGCTGILAHSFMDFNLHIPANAALFYVMCAVATLPVSGKNRSRVILPKQYGPSE
jgi:O-antigen ligase